jgi:hypothetical protein
MGTSYKRQTYFNPTDSQQILIEKLNREFQALERARAVASGSTTVISQSGSSGGGGISGSGSTIVIRLLDGSLVLTGVSELALDQTFGLTLAALSGSSAKIGLALTHNVIPSLQGGGTGEYYHLILTDYTKVTTETFVNMHLSGFLHLQSMAAPATPAADSMVMYMRTIAGTPNEIRWVTLDPNGQESILHSYTV